jgi:parvulin-like peptidyl-prolyl isomerase
MSGRSNQRPAGRRWPRLLLAAGCVGGVVGVGCWLRSAVLAGARPQAPASIPAARNAPPPPSAPAATSDYVNRVVAYVYDNEPVTRQELGEYLITRHGAAALKLLVNKRIIERECRARGLEVTAGEVEAAFSDDLKGLNVNRDTFVSTFLSRYKKNLYEWKEDVIRPKLLLNKLCRDRVRAEEQEVRNLFESKYGEKVQCRIILWPPSKNQEKEAMACYNEISGSEEAFAEKAKHQQDPNLSAAGGRIKPIAWHTMGDDKLEAEAFKLRPGAVSTVLPTKQGLVVIKCDGRVPADTTVNLEAKRAELTREIVARKVDAEMGGAFQKLYEEAHPALLLQADKDGGLPPREGMPAPTEVVATYNGNTPITREELGEFLIARHGAEKLDLLVNRRILDKACRERGVAVTPEEIEEGLEADLAVYKADRKHFVEDILSKQKISLCEWKEDVVRTRLLLTKLCRDRVKATDEDVKQAFEAYHGERLECRFILWPADQAKFALREYARLRDSEEEFARMAKAQPCATLAAKGGRVDPFGKHTLGDDALEREAFKLEPGEVSTLIGTPQGNVVIKCDRRIPPDTEASLEQERPKLVEEVLKKKVNIEMQVVFKQLREQARPRLVLKDPNRPVDLAAETREILSDVKEPLAMPRKGAPVH